MLFAQSNAEVRRDGPLAASTPQKRHPAVACITPVERFHFFSRLATHFFM